MIYKFDFSWGDTRGIRKIMSDLIYQEGLDQSIPWHTFGYPPHEGDTGLIWRTRELVKGFTGHEYKHILITNGATHALNAYIAAKNNENIRGILTHDKYFMFYPGIAKNHHLIHFTRPEISGAECDKITIIASPSNPEGNIFGPLGVPERSIWDAAYYTPTYCDATGLSGLAAPIRPTHEAMAGSYSKLTGINGLRVGWLATDSDQVYQKALEWTEHDICGVSYPSQSMVAAIIKGVDLEAFYGTSKALLDTNREELAKLGYLFGHQAIPNNGMFALLEVDKKLKRLLEKVSVHVMDGSLCGDTRESVRFNLANGREITNQMVKAILKEDNKS